MDIKTYFKKYGILTIVAVIFIAAIGYFVYDSTQGVIPSKKVNGEDVLVAMDGYEITADELYAEMLDSEAGMQAAYMYFVRALVEATVPTTEEMTTNAQAASEYIVSQLSSYGEDYLNTQLHAVGLRSTDDLVGYYISYYKLEQLVADYTENNDLFKKFYDEKQPRIVSHILVKCEDPENPTAEEKAKMEAVDAALASGTSFADVAKEYSEDGSASDGGNLGYADATTSYVEPFLNAMLAAEENVVTEWVQTQYGYHRILVTASSYDNVKDNSDVLSAFNDANPTLEYEAVYAASKEVSMSFENETVEKVLNQFFNEVLGGEE